MIDSHSVNITESLNRVTANDVFHPVGQWKLIPFYVICRLDLSILTKHGKDRKFFVAILINDFYITYGLPEFRKTKISHQRFKIATDRMPQKF